MIYYLISWFLSFKYPNYRHHRNFNPFGEGLRWLKSWAKKWCLKAANERVVNRIVAKWSKKYFFVPLQVHKDSQILRHSSYESIEQFIEEVLVTFAKTAAKDEMLVFKHHPMDRAYSDYRSYISELTREWGLEGRVEYIFEGWLPALLDHAKGVIVVNSTVGFSALMHGAPTIALGRAIYDFEGLSSQQTLADFMISPISPDKGLVKAFRGRMVVETQLNLNFYAPHTYKLGLKGIGKRFQKRVEVEDDFAAYVSRDVI